MDVHGRGLEHRRSLIPRRNAALHREIAVRHIDEVAARAEIVVVVLGMIVAQTVGKDELLRECPRIFAVERPARTREAAVVVRAALTHHIDKRRRSPARRRNRPLQMVVHPLALPACPHRQCVIIAERCDILRIERHKVILHVVADL